jgi:hypothetical protein
MGVFESGIQEALPLTKPHWLLWYRCPGYVEFGIILYMLAQSAVGFLREQ